MKADFHVHTFFSGDCESKIEDIIRCAINNGITDLAITDHNDFNYYDGDTLFELPMNKYYEQITNAIEHYKGQINLYFAIEMGLDKRYPEKIYKLIDSYPFDFVIGSSHVINGMDPYYPEYFNNKTISGSIEEYFSSILENLEIFDCFDVYGHIDYIIRYIPVPYEERIYSYDQYKELLDRILHKIISMNKGIEINTSSLSKGFKETNPSSEVLKKYAQAGGRIITIGSDAHKANMVGYGFDNAVNILKDSGFSHYCIFKNRTCKFISL